MTTRMTSKDAGELIFDLLADERNQGGLSQVEILQKTGLTPSQFNNGKDYLRGVFTDDGKVYSHCNDQGEPWVYDPRDGKYRLDAEEETVIDYLYRELAGLGKRTLRLLNGTGNPAEVKFGSNSWTLVRRDLTRFVEDLELMTSRR